MSEPLKPHLRYEEQVSLLQGRGLIVEDPQRAIDFLRLHNYYRLSGYWHSMRRVDPETRESLNVFRPGASFELVVDLYNYDARLRAATFAALVPIETAAKSLMGYALGEIDPLIHTKPALLNAVARQPDRNDKNRTAHEVWLGKYRAAVRSSREDFVEHHRKHYSSQLPVWVAVEVMDWGMVSHLFRFSPHSVRNAIADQFGMNAPQLESTLRSLNVLRNYAAHNARLFNRGFDLRPKPINDPLMEPVNRFTHRVFGQLSLVHFARHNLGLSHDHDLAEALDAYPHNQLIPFSRTGTPTHWRDLPLWAGE